jgi:hypothetical protein
MNCHNCMAAYQGHYCHECGQKAAEIKYTMKGMVTDLFFSAIHMEKKGLFHTVRELTLRPGIAIKKVLMGQRQFLYPPFKYLVLLGAAVIIFSLRYKFFHNEFTELEGNDLPSWLYLTAQHRMYLQDFFHFAEDEATLLNIVTIPIFAFFSWAFLSKGKYNFAENLIINTFITAQQLLFLLILVPFLEFIPDAKVFLIQVYTLITIGYNAWVYIQFFDGNKFWLPIKSVLVVLLCYVYQFPVNLGIYYFYHNFLHENFHWVLE